MELRRTVDYKLTEQSIYNLKEAGMLPKSTVQIQALIRCVHCVLGRAEGFDPKERDAQACSSGLILKSSVREMLRGLVRKNIVTERILAEEDTLPEPNAPTTVVYDITDAVKKKLIGEQPLPNCQLRKP